MKTLFFVVLAALLITAIAGAGSYAWNGGYWGGARVPAWMGYGDCPMGYGTLPTPPSPDTYLEATGTATVSGPVCEGNGAGVEARGWATDAVGDGNRPAFRLRQCEPNPRSSRTRGGFSFILSTM